MRNNSTGPKTPEGKARSAQNATKHGLQARHLLPDENPDAFTQLKDVYFSEYPPRNVWEFDVLEDIVWAKWMKLRHRNTEAAVLTLLADPKSLDVDPAYAPIARAFIQNAGPDGVLNLLHRYGVAISRDYLRQLREFQRLRPDAFPNAALDRAARVSEQQAPSFETPREAAGEGAGEQAPAPQQVTPKFRNELPPLAVARDRPRDSITNHHEWPVLKNLLFTAITPYPEATASVLAKLRELPE